MRVSMYELFQQLDFKDILALNIYKHTHHTIHTHAHTRIHIGKQGFRGWFLGYVRCTVAMLMVTEQNNNTSRRLC